MKTPRITDFDPDAKVPALKSPLNGMPPIGKPPQKINDASPAPLSEKRAIQEGQDKEKKQNRTPHPVPHLETNNRPVKPRHAFDIYQDQYESLLELSLEERRQGGTGSMSAMVREALDKFIAERKKK